MKKLIMFRQGDVLLRQIASIPENAKRQKTSAPIVLALGEATGHKHQIEDFAGVDVFVKADGTMYLQVNSPSDLKHEEHATITLPTGNYERVLQVEYSPEAIRQVAD